MKPVIPDLSPLRGRIVTDGLRRRRAHVEDEDGQRRSAWRRGGEQEDNKNVDVDVEGVVEPGALNSLPQPKEDEPDTQRNIMPKLEKVEDMPPPEDVKDMPPLEDAEEHWVVVFGYPPHLANYVLKMFKRNGVVLKHVPGPGDANWVHIQYEDRSGALTAVSQNGVQIKRAVMIGVKHVDAMQHQDLNERFERINQKPPSLSTEMTISDWVFGNPFSGDWARKVDRSTPGLRKSTSGLRK